MSSIITIIYLEYFTSGVSSRGYQEKVHVNTVSQEEKESFKKEPRRS